MQLPNLKPIGTEVPPCKICGSASTLYGVVDFNRSCEEVRGRFLPLSGVPVNYRRCPTCGFLFTDSFDRWTEADFKEHIHNDDYVVVDPDYVETRPAANAGLINHLFERDKARLRVLDYGGGNGVLSQALTAAGFLSAQTYDPFSPEHATLPGEMFDIVTCFETFEHSPNPLATIDVIAERTADPGIVIFSTLVQPEDFDNLGLNWWYIGPRNGHISLFTRQALGMAWESRGYTFGSFDDNLHVAFRRCPDFARHLTGAP